MLEAEGGVGRLKKGLPFAADGGLQWGSPVPGKCRGLVLGREAGAVREAGAGSLWIAQRLLLKTQTSGGEILNLLTVP